MKKTVKAVPFSCHCKLNVLIAHLKSISAGLQHREPKAASPAVPDTVYLPRMSYMYSYN